MKILYLTPGCFDKGGISRYSRYQIQALRENFSQENIRVISMLGPDDYSFEDPFEVHRHCGGNGLISKLRFLWFYFRSLLFWRPDLVLSAHINYAPLISNWHGSSKLRLLNVYGLEVWNNMTSRKIRALRTVDAIISDCHNTRDFLMSKYNLQPKKIHVIWDCVDTMKFHAGTPDPTVLRKYGIDPDERSFVILTLGRIAKNSRHKGYENLLKVLKLLLERGRKVKVYFAGGGDFLETLQKDAHKLSVSDYALFLGRIDENDMRDIYSSCDVFSLISTTQHGGGEGIPLTPLEAMACGKPVLVGTEDGSREAIQNNNGFALDPIDLDEHVVKIEAYLNNPDLLKIQGENASKLIQQQFGYQTFKSRHSKLLSALNSWNT